MKQLSRLRSIVVLLCLFGASYTASAANFFYWNADSTSTPQGKCNLNEASIDSTGGHDGGGAMRYNLSDGGGQTGCRDLANTDNIGAGKWTSGKSLYYRWWMKIDPGFSWGDRGIFKIGRLTDNGTDLLTFYLNDSEINIESSRSGIGCPGGVCASIAYPFDGPAALNYQEYIIRLDLQNSASGKGTLSLYVNGTLVGSETRQLYDCSLGCGTIGAASWGWAMGQSLYAQLCLSGSCGAGGKIWVDDLSVDDTWNSNLGGGGGGTVGGGDSAPPAISSVQASSITQTGATITASTSEPADFQVEYGLTTGYGQSTIVNSGMVTSHSVTLGGLGANTLYHYRVRSTDAAGNLATSGDKTFTTLNNVNSGGNSNECDNWKVAHPDWIWCDDFEAASISTGQGGYLEYDNNSGDFIPVNGAGRNNSYGMRARWQAGEVNAGSLKLVFGRNPIGDKGIRSAENFREIYYRTHVRTESGWTGDPEKLARLVVFSKSNWSEAMIAHLWSPDSGGGTLAIDPVRCVSGSSVVCSGYNDFSNMTWLGLKSGSTRIFSTANADKWYCVEAHVKLNDPGQSNGVQEFWVNGQLEARSSNLNFVGSYADYALNAVFLENYWNAGSSQLQERYLDNFVVSTQRIGCDPQSNISPPMPPSNIQ